MNNLLGIVRPFFFSGFDFGVKCSSDEEQTLCTRPPADQKHPKAGISSPLALRLQEYHGIGIQTVQLKMRSAFLVFALDRVCLVAENTAREFQRFVACDRKIDIHDGQNVIDHTVAQGRLDVLFQVVLHTLEKMIMIVIGQDQDERSIGPLI